MSPFDFYRLTIREAELILKGYEKEKEEQFNLNSISFYNAIGAAFGGNKFKPKNPFYDSKKAHKVTKEKRDKELKYLNKLFKKFGGDLNVK